MERFWSGSHSVITVISIRMETVFDIHGDKGDCVEHADRCGQCLPGQDSWRIIKKVSVHDGEPSEEDQIRHQVHGVAGRTGDY